MVERGQPCLVSQQFVHCYHTYNALLDLQRYAGAYLASFARVVCKKRFAMLGYHALEALPERYPSLLESLGDFAFESGKHQLACLLIDNEETELLGTNHVYKDFLYALDYFCRVQC